ncbi:hypothetical protein G6F59_018447 [Rhizopus arrhizus]|nr:hypothetical protein G6F59_018447 [Rhizopus arrhizus]
MADAVEHGELGQADRRDRRQPGRAPGARGAGRTATGAGRARPGRRGRHRWGRGPCRAAGRAVRCGGSCQSFEQCR